MLSRGNVLGNLSRLPLSDLWVALSIEDDGDSSTVPFRCLPDVYMCVVLDDQRSLSSLHGLEF